MSKTIRVGAVQAEPAWLNLEEGVAKTIQIIEQAAADVWTLSPLQQGGWVPEYVANSMSRDGPEMARIQAAAKKANMTVVLGYSEREGTSLYISQAIIGPSGEILLNRRKIKPTHIERTVWGDSQQDGLNIVVDTPLGRVGALNCWEHLQPLMRYYEYTQNVQIHVASWPPVFEARNDGGPLYQLSRTPTYNVNQVMAMEGALFVIAATQVLTEKSLEKCLLVGNNVTKTPSGGFSQIFGPDGRPLGEPIDEGVEGIVKADINLDDLTMARMVIDVAGHYSRPDLLGLRVNPSGHSQVTVVTSPSVEAPNGRC
ncbi:Aliphatic nitrilase [Escovopsis weberi]|uniref:nitrilase n=1 Tax=Escovopsis weberi TaxID=150374 RepID=A0A0M8MWN6_ESCWE|nr:Aliphatic nitrilase [Escovopsis weberi]